ncbi:MAG: LytR C-terminal domain-containing protein [Candidatus Marinimicrobia bacterium]|nr:LytR C-terminal domain-containing protein [Candidatus Neomarinimicrobiota bacterium]
MARTGYRRKGTSGYRSATQASQQVWLKRRRGFQQVIFNLSILTLSALVIGFVISAITTRSGVQMTLTSDELVERSRYLSAPATDFRDETADLQQANRLVVEVLNGIGVSGLASRYTDFLRDAGYDVVRFTNAQRNDYPRTLVINRGSNYDRALEVARTLGIEAREVENMPDPSLQLDVTIVLGQDYRTLTSYRALSSGRRK